MERRTELDATVSADGEKVQTLKAANADRAAKATKADKVTKADKADKAGMLGLKAEKTHHHKVEDVSTIRRKEELDADVEMVNKNIATLKHIRAKLEGRQQ